MTHAELLHAQLVDHEGLRLRPYLDTVGQLTIGVGRNLTGKGISRAEAFVLLENDIQEALADLVTFPWFEQLGPVRQRAVIDLRFNLGPAKFRGFAHALTALSASRFGVAADELLASRWASQVGRRAVRVAAMVRTGIDPEATGS